MLEKILSIILNEGLIERVFMVLAIICPLLGLLLGFGMGKLRNRSLEYGLKGFFFGLLGTVNYIMYQVYSYRVRYDPETGYVGLHHVSVLITNIVIFIGLGIGLGLLYRLIFRRYGQ